MNNLFIILPAIAIASIVILYILTRNAYEIKEEKPKINFYDLDKFQPRKVTDLSKPTVPKKKYYKKKKKKPAIANNAPVDKKPVGRPKKSE